MRRAILAITFALSTPALSQASPGALAGSVVDAATQKPIADAVVIAKSPSLPGEQSAVTDASGSFEMTFLPPGTYSLAVTCEGCVPYSPAGVMLKSGKVRVRIAVLPVPSAASIQAAAVEFDDNMTAPAMISGPAPEYTAEALERGVEGSMEVRCVVTSEGQVRACKVVKGLPFMNAAVVDALQRRTYKPATAQGKPVDVYYTFTLRLKLPPAR